jgi:hypothetical protein
VTALLRANPSVVRGLHRRVLRLVADAQREYGDLGLRLEGGTALAAYYLHNRESEDLDFFGRPGMDARDFACFVAEQAAAAGIAVVGKGCTGLRRVAQRCRPERSGAWRSGGWSPCQRAEFIPLCHKRASAYRKAAFGYPAPAESYKDRRLTS